MPKVYEAESAASNVSNATTIKGYTGTGYRNSAGLAASLMSGQYVTWTVSAPTAGTYKATFRYATTVAASRRLTVNSSTVTNALSFPAKVRILAI